MICKIVFLTVTLISAFSTVQAQEFKHLTRIEPKEEFENINVLPLNDSKDASSFLIWVKQHVKEHYHAEHTEMVYVLEGSGTMTLGNEKKSITEGDYIFIPKGTPHSVEVTNSEILKVISIQSPHFDGTDRHFTSPN